MNCVFRTIALVVVLLTSRSLYAQNATENQLQVSIGAIAGWDSAIWFRAEGTPGQVISRYKNGYLAGASCTLEWIALHRISLGIRSEIFFVQKGSLREIPGARPTTFELDYLDIPVLVRGALRLTESIQLHVVTGPQVGTLLRARRIDVNGNVQKQTDFYDRIEIGWSVGLGAEIVVYPNVALSVAGRYDEGLTNINSASETPGLRHRTFFVTLGVDWKVWRSSPEVSAQSAAK